MPKASINVIKKHLPLIQKYKREYPYLSGQKLAMVIKEKENMTIDQDYLRSIINGSAMVKEIEPVNFDEVDFNIELPETLSIERENFKIPAGIDRVLFISDAHIPFHSIEPIKIALKYAYENGVRGIFLGGDIFDFYASSNFLRPPGLRNLQKEIKSGRTFLYNLRDKFPDIEIYFKEGNHEFRYQRKLMESSPELFEVDSLQLDEVLHLPKLNIKYIDYYTITEFGKLSIIHGHEIRGGGIHVAHNFRVKAGANVLCGHFHRTQESIFRNIKNELIGSWSVGCLCGLSPDYMSVNNWNHGFAFLTRERDGNFTVKNKKIIKGYIH